MTHARQMLARSFELLRAELPRVRAVLSYADPLARSTVDGRQVTPGHVGIIYQAFNGRFLGRSAARTVRLAPDGRLLSPRRAAIGAGATGQDVARMCPDLTAQQIEGALSELQRAEIVTCTGDRWEPVKVPRAALAPSAGAYPKPAAA